MNEISILGTRGEWDVNSLFVHKGLLVPVVGSIFISPIHGKIKALIGSGPLVEGRKSFVKGDKPFHLLDCVIA